MSADTFYPKNLVFVCENNEQIAVPEQFPKFSRFLQDYLKNCMGENVDEKSKEEACKIQLSQINIKHLKIIFDFLQQWKRKMPSEYNEILLDGEYVKKIIDIPTWSQAFFQMVHHDDLLSAANAANFLAVPVFIKYFTNYFVTRLESCESSSEMASLMNLENDFSRHEKETHKRFSSSSSWKELVMDSTPEKESMVDSLLKPNNSCQFKENNQSDKEFSNEGFGSNAKITF